MERRLELHEMLCNILGSRHAYFQPPESIKMNYPAIVYGINDIDNMFANNNVYLSKKQYSITLIDKNPDSPLIDKILAIPSCTFGRYYSKDDLNHVNFTIIF